MKTKTIDITPTWASLVKPMLMVIANPHAKLEARMGMQEEIERMAKLADLYVKSTKQDD